MRRKLFNNYSSFGGVNSGGKMSPNQRTKSGSSSQGGNESQDSIDWGPMESALSSGISNDEQFANANWVKIKQGVYDLFCFANDKRNRSYNLYVVI